ncbi:hypothetical protein CVT25_003630 [Psilocybe cyanescens]|uniref:Sodium/hydrogen exchanger n=1 Tax=Psilocybe cyanescens TaxID=93625 RepID=A0A409WPC1_PSICY|nr:hypothetical protein CVT25_003630 [Psilocybe cyanescens]
MTFAALVGLGMRPGALRSCSNRSDARLFSSLLQASSSSCRPLNRVQTLGSSRNLSFWGSSSKPAPQPAATPEVPQTTEETATAVADMSSSIPAAPAAETPLPADASAFSADTVSSVNVPVDSTLLSDITEAIANHAPAALQYGDLAAMGLAGWSPAGLVRWSMEIINVTTGMPWFWTIIAGSAFWRLVCVPFAIKGLQASARMQPHQAQLVALQQEIKNTAAKKDPIAIKKATVKMQEFYKKHDINPLGGIVALVQMPITLGIFFGVQKLCKLPVEQLHNSGVGFLPDLTVADPTYIMPLALCAMINIQILAGARDINTHERPEMGHIMNIFRILTIPGIAFMASFPSGLVLSLMTTAILTTLQTLIMRIPAIRHKLRIPIAHPSTYGRLPSVMETFRYVSTKIRRNMSFKLASVTHAATAAAATTPPAGVPEEEEYYSSWSLFLVCMLLILSLLTSYYLQIKRIRAVHETLVSIFAGMVVGAIIRLAPGTMIREMLTFKHTLFFNLLLPPIILNSGYELKQDNFFRNFGSILTFAFLGTFISAVGVGVLVFIYSYLGIDTDKLPLIECLIFGSTLSATDPVTILAIFNQYKVDPKLYTVIFGESLLNDAVSIVMYETLSRFTGTEIFVGSIFHGIGIFLLSFSVSMALGVAFGLSTSLMLKHSYLHLYPSIESCLVALCAYTCYFFSNGLQCSGIVSLLFCGITLKHYAYHTMSRRTQRATKYIFSTLARLSENFIFIYLGMSLFTSAPVSEPVFSYVRPVFIIITTIAVVFTRYAAVFPLSEGINLFHKHVRGQRQEELPHSHQMMLFWAGLRGAVGVALAAGFVGPHAQMMRTTVLIVVVLTVVIFGGTTARMLEVLGIRTGVEDDAGASSDEDEAALPPSRNAFVGRGGNGVGGRWSRFAEEDTSALNTPGDPRGAAGRIGTHYASRFNHQYQNSHENGEQSPVLQGNTIFSSSSSDSYDSDGGEVLPLVPSTDNNGNGNNNSNEASHPPRQNSLSMSMGIGEDGKWFQALDERYLLPIFSNATASRTFHARRARRTTSGLAGGPGASNIATPADSEDEVDLGQDVEMGRSGGGGGVGGAQSNSNTRTLSADDSRLERGLPSPVLRNNSSAESRFSS